MREVLEICRGLPETAVEPGGIILTENERTGRLYVLAEGTLEVFRGDVSIAFVTEPGAVFGEMSFLLDLPHTASVRAVGPSKIFVIDDALDYFRQNPVLMIPIAQLLARRLQSCNTYLVDLKHQFQDRSDHFGMVDQVLESLMNRQNEDFTPGGDLPAEP